MKCVAVLLSSTSLYIASGSVILVLLLFVYFVGDPSRLYHGRADPKPLPSGTATSYYYLHGGTFGENGSPSVPLKSYMFSLRILEQLTMCTAHFHQFLNLVNDWGFTGVEPYAYGSTMFGLRSIHANNPSGSVPFNKMFNATIHNDYLSKCMKRQSDPETGTPVLFEPMSEFLRRLHRRIVLIYFAACKELDTVLSNDLRKKMEDEINKEKGPFMDCTLASRAHGMSKRVESLLAKEIELEENSPSHTLSRPLPKNLEHFVITQAFCIRWDIKISLCDLRDYVHNHIHRNKGSIESSIIFIGWQGRFTHPLVDSDVSNYINRCRIPFSQPFHSDFVLNLAKRYLNSLNLQGQPYLSVHVRFEKLYLMAKAKHSDVKKFVTCCTDRLNTVLSVVAEKFQIASRNNILLTWDYSPHGSMEYAWPVNGEQSKAIADEQLKSVLKARPVYFKPQDFNIPAHQSIVSLVEMDVLLNASALVTMGGGSYQHTIVQTFVERHRDPENPGAAEELHYGHLCVERLEEVHGIRLPPNC